MVVMSGYSPTWTSKGSDKLRILQVTKILMNIIDRLINSIDVTDEKTKNMVEGIIANTIYNYFTPNKDLAIEKQYEYLLEFLGWKLISIEKKDDDSLSLSLGANRFIDEETDNLAYNAIVLGIAKSIGYFIFNKDVKVELMVSQFDSTQITALIERTDKEIAVETQEKLGIQISKEEGELGIEQKQAPATKKTPAIEVKPELELDVKSIFSPILQNYPPTSILPVFHKVLSEIVTSFFSEIEDSQVINAKASYSEINTVFLIEFILRTLPTIGKDVSEIATLAGQYLIKAILTKTPDDIIKYLPKELLSEISRRVSYVEFGARDYCSYAPGERCVEGKRDLCDFVLFFWQGMLDSLIPEKKFKLGERIPATRRGKFCLVEFIKQQ
ncbi:MAG: hypothetical protein ACTSRR_01025 [Candidatus Heimdallarchaeaceae archaeon]